ncbi:tRNA (adenosine(37)-N6)-dimethylallyltransferase MiaA [Ruminococcus sp. FC2018]|uniref:tRNA (adenosine(37)-N6)-dimethylallyltransferase MiaA n=1 Tax=Ruminococcus sp. FC2018 TaxID=1410617 RepID=UPI00048D80DC|nr:tRNA (adenosine(37)-N6)-dimethylallyltransferase MiaA [Ruminococcus sp. FC2018]
MKKIPVVVICGPTASGKTAVSVELARKLNGEVISADSMQIYKDLQIATAKPTADEMNGVVHHLVDVLDLDMDFSVADYVRQASEIISEVYSRGKLPIVCGGTGLYITSLIENVKFDDTGNDNAIRQRLSDEAKEKGNHLLWERLYEVDPETALKVHENNLPRVIRALEVYELTGVTLSQHKINSRKEESPYDSCIIGLTCEDRDKLYDRINKRVDVMVDNGLVDECRAVYEQGGLKTACQAIGFKELIPYFNGDLTVDECIDKIKLETRHYAKRQLTWFRNLSGIQWVYIDKFDSFEKIIKNIENIVAKSKIMCYNRS